MAYPMNYIPYVSSWWHTLEQPPKCHFDQYVGKGADLSTNDNGNNPDIEAKYKAAIEKTGVSHITYDSDKYLVTLDAQHFKPEELSVKMDDNCILVEGHHDETQDEHGFVTRSFKRRYILPSDIKPEAIKASISSDGVLHLEAPRPKHDDKVGKTIPIEFESTTANTTTTK